MVPTRKAYIPEAVRCVENGVSQESAHKCGELNMITRSTVVIVEREQNNSRACKVCGWLFACDECSEAYDRVDQQLRKQGL